MTVQFSITSDNVDAMIDDLKRIFPSLVAGAPLPPMQEQPKRDEPAPVTGEVIDPPAPKERKARKPKEPETIENEPKSEAAEIPDIKDVRARLLAFASTDGLGHDEVFKLLKKFGATNASTVPDYKRAELIAEIDARIEGAK